MAAVPEGIILLGAGTIKYGVETHTFPIPSCPVQEDLCYSIVISYMIFRRELYLSFLIPWHGTGNIGYESRERRMPCSQHIN
jgi:hypothetical protein